MVNLQSKFRLGINGFYEFRLGINGFYDDSGCSSARNLFYISIRLAGFLEFCRPPGGICVRGELINRSSKIKLFSAFRLRLLRNHDELLCILF